MQKEYKDKGALILALTDEPEPLVRQFAKSNQISYPVGYGALKSRQAHDVRAYPTFFVYDAQGRQIYKGHNPQEAEQALGKCLRDSSRKGA